MQVISAAQVMQALDMRRSIELMKTALIALSSGDVTQMVRPVLPLYGRNLIGMMPAYYKSGKVAGVKILSVFPDNYKQSIPSHQGEMIVFETETGKVKAVVDAESLTGMRTAAVSAAVTDVMARFDATQLAILGAGLQGRRHLEAISLVRTLKEVTVWDLRPEAAALYKQEMEDKFGIPVRVCSTVKEATQNADIICTLTPAEDPILFAKDVKKGTHINAVGACTPQARELASDLMAQGKIFVDWKPATLLEAGDYLLAKQDGAITEDAILGEVGAVLAGSLPGRTNEREITIFEALGQAIQDLVMANYVADTLIDKEVKS